MKFELSHRFDHPPEVVWALLLSDDYARALDATSEVKKVREREDQRGDVLFVRSLCTSPRELPAAMRRATGMERLSYHLEELREASTHTVRWRVISPKMSDRVQIHGTYRVVPAKGGCERLVNGEIKVAVPLLGGKIESGISKELMQGYEAAAAFARDWLREHAR